MDKVIRFEREVMFGRSSRFYIATIILVDRIGANSRIEQLATDLGGTIIQMSASYWPQQVARTLNQVLGFDHELVTMSQPRISEFLEDKLSSVPLEDFIGLDSV